MGLPLPCSSSSTGGGHKSCVWLCFGQVFLRVAPKSPPEPHHPHPWSCSALTLSISVCCSPSPSFSHLLLAPSRCCLLHFSLSDSSKPISVPSMLAAPHPTSVAAGLSLHQCAVQQTQSILEGLKGSVNLL